jgi:diguanylate cyclase (GGDEF)-like protein/PAS domain S-box-containing protein
VLSLRKSVADVVARVVGHGEASGGRGDALGEATLLQEGRPSASSRAVFQVIYEHGDQAVLLCDDKGRMRAANPAARQLMGMVGDEWRGRPLGDWLRLPPRAHRSDMFWQQVPDGEYEVAVRGTQSAATSVSLRVRVGRHGDRVQPVILLRDTNESRRIQQAVERLASYDSLTGLPNRAHFRNELGRAMERARRGNKPMALFFLDLDRFKVINDSLGHEAGDQLLQTVAQLLAGCLRGSDSVLMGPRTEGATLSRLGGDEFTIILEDVGSAEDAAIVARRLLEALAKPFSFMGEDIQISTSIGISMFPMDDVDLDGMIRHADMAMYRSKALGRNTYSFFSDDLNSAVKARLSLEGSLRRALERQEFQLFFQPKASLRTREVTGVEALIRWHCPGRGMVPPDRFISVLEDTGLIVQAGAWVIREACAQLARWDAMGLPPLAVAVNLSARQLRQAHLVSLVRDSLEESGIAPSRLELELTESLLMEDTEGNRAVLSAFADLGVRLAIDDFGTGHSSLSYLKRLDVDTLKIDRSFVMQLPDDPEDVAIATAVVALGKSLDMHVVAEGVETEAQARFLEGLGCHEMQGWLLSKALPPDQLTPWLQKRHIDHLRRLRPQSFSGVEVTELVELDLGPPGKARP